jgi:ATP-dependent protease Clp ATPase subunit
MSVKFGLIPELVGRLPVLALFWIRWMLPMHCKRILIEPKNCAGMLQYEKLFDLEGIQAEVFLKMPLIMLPRKPWNSTSVRVVYALSARPL